ncbi:hypothetical protein ACJRO7_002163 [Eucalyptus globulus]|uniref:Protein DETOXIFICATION n=1 Tax=Eucalyptus globulus TaxID=34317 RepID=A0ABD3LUH9_EUCGL
MTDDRMEERLLGTEAKDMSSLAGRVWAESKKAWRVTFPAMLARVTNFGVFVVTQAFIGHISKTELAAYALIQIIGVRFANGILLGMSSATETLCGQAFGAKQYPMLGIYLQRSWIINLVTATVLVPVFVYTSSIFKLLGVEDEMAEAAGYIALWFIPIILELWYNAVLVLLAGYMTNATVAISAFSICLNISAWELMMCLGFLAGASVRVSNELGRGNVKAAVFAIKVILGTSFSIGVVFWALCLVFGRQIAYIFTSEEDIAEEVSSLSVLLAFSILLNSVQPVLSGVAVGSGRQSMVAYVNIGSYYVIGVPLGVVLAYVAKWEVQGIWIGMIIGVATQTAVLGFITYRTNWDEQVNKASERVNKWFLKRSNDNGESAATEQPSE